MEAALAEVAVEVADVVIAIEQAAKAAQVLAEPRRRDRRILPAFPCRMVRGHVRGRAETGFPRAPDLLRVAEIVEDSPRRTPWDRRGGVGQARGVAERFLLSFSAELDEQPAGAIWQLRQGVGAHTDVPDVAHQPVVHALEADWLELDHARH